MRAVMLCLPCEGWSEQPAMSPSCVALKLWEKFPVLFGGVYAGCLPEAMLEVLAYASTEGNVDVEYRCTNVSQRTGGMTLSLHPKAFQSVQPKRQDLTTNRRRLGK